MPYTIGLDFGSLSARGVLADTHTGEVRAQADFVYPHGILDHALPDGTPLGPRWCLQDPADYEDALFALVPALLRRSGVPAGQIAGLGIDATASTVIPLDGGFRPLCWNGAFAGRPHSWPKMWKHHAAAGQASDLAQIITRLNPGLLTPYGGAVSPEGLLPKVLQVFQEDPAVYDSAVCFMELGDYLTSLLAGEPVFSASLLRCKALWNGQYPVEALAALDPALGNLPGKLMDRYPGRGAVPPGGRAGRLCSGMADRLGLPVGLALSPPQMDAYAAVPGVGIRTSGHMLLTLGTSAGMLCLGGGGTPVPGICASLPDTVYPGLTGYASGLASMGDGFQWFIDNSVPPPYHEVARVRGMDLYQYLSALAAPLAPGESGLIALGWWNGSKSCPVDGDLSGMLLGLTLQTRPEHVYRALLEASAYGARTILDAHGAAGVPVKDLTACGGIAGKNPLLLQLWADVLARPILVSRCTQAPALGSAVYAAAAAEIWSLPEAVDRMGCREGKLYTPRPRESEAYLPLYAEYRRLADHFGGGADRLMARLLWQAGDHRCTVPTDAPKKRLFFT